MYKTFGITSEFFVFGTLTNPNSNILMLMVTEDEIPNILSSSFTIASLCLEFHDFDVIYQTREVENTTHSGVFLTKFEVFG